MSQLCRDCFSSQISGNRCKNCHSRRVLNHLELNDLFIAHVDCDAFYASVEKRDRPELRNVPLIVGGGTRGVVSTCCYLARIKGIRSAMPMFQAKKLCPEAVILSPDFPRYQEASRAIRAAFDALTPAVEPLSLDEAYLDMRGTNRVHGASPAWMLAKMAQAIENKVGITVSIGLSHNKFLAKLASEMNKPRGFSVIGKAETEVFLTTLPVGKLHGVGKVFEARLKNDGLYFVGDIRALDEVTLIKRYGQSGQWLARLSQGQDSRRISGKRVEKSISTETTFSTDVSTREHLNDTLWDLVEKLSYRLKKQNVMPNILTLKVKTANFKSLTRQIQTTAPSWSPEHLYHVGLQLLDKLEYHSPFRLIGIGGSDLHPPEANPSVDLFSKNTQLNQSLDIARDQIRARFGRDAIRQGRSLARKN